MHVYVHLLIWYACYLPHLSNSYSVTFLGPLARLCYIPHPSTATWAADLVSKLYLASSGLTSSERIAIHVLLATEVITLNLGILSLPLHYGCSCLSNRYPLRLTLYCRYLRQNLAAIEFSTRAYSCSNPEHSCQLYFLYSSTSNPNEIE